MYSVRMAYLFWVPSLFGVAGLQRLYLGKFGTGILYLMTGGLLGIGTIYDALTLPAQVREARLRVGYRDAIGPIHVSVTREPDDARPRSKPRSVEQTILHSAKANGGVITPSEVAIEAGISLDEAKRVLEKLADKGFAEIRVKKSGLIVYVIPDLADEYTKTELEDF
ncbi:MAG: NINE protein [Spirochaetaceae bacterium]|nr:MAG: NINE protein [Spirochaetaceae bacterium]